MLNKWVLTAAISAAILLFMQPARAEHLWWQGGNQDAYRAAPFSDDSPDQDEQFNQREYELYRREMNSRYGRGDSSAIPADPRFGDLPNTPPPPYPRYMKKKPKLTKTRPVRKSATQEASGKRAPLSTPSKNPPTASLKKAKAKAMVIDCTKGAGIVSSFGFSSVTSKDCTGKSRLYSAEHGANKFEVEVNSATGELTSVNKL